MASSLLNPDSWEGKCVHSESTLHQLSPFLGKMKSTMAAELITSLSETGDHILDPFSGSGTVPLEAAINNRNAVAIDRNPYSVLLSKAKLQPPESLDAAKNKAQKYLKEIDPDPAIVSDRSPEWVRKFFHPKTLSGIEQLSAQLRSADESFLLACLLGILHHQRPGFLSFPASNLRPYLRDEKFPKDEYPEKYEYRQIEPRLTSKIERAYRRFPDFQPELQRRVLNGNTPEVMEESIADSSVDTIVTSPPYMNKLDYGRDNRLRLYFLGIDDYRSLDESPGSRDSYEHFLHEFLTQAERVLKPKGSMTFVLGESRRSGSAVDTSEILSDMVKSEKYRLTVRQILQDQVPIREINSMSSNTETIIMLEREE